MPGKLVYRAHQLTMHDMTEVTTVPLLANPGGSTAGPQQRDRRGAVNSIPRPKRRGSVAPGVAVPVPSQALCTTPES